MDTVQEIYLKPSKAGCEIIDSLPDEEVDTKKESDKKWVRCRNCNYKIALYADKIKIDNTDTHIFENPAGIFFRVVCFSEAPGSINISDYTGDDTWFSGYLWSISFCRSCSNHLGWHYDSGSGQFYGLIADRLTGI
ncbi:MAG TPA: cereblon family protein [Spirochaetota bacterium]|nr:cereblon family protein [Spirochaetota bacterium]HPS85950.1 cereblon family protein [Spirochaetota bacterium]